MIDEEAPPDAGGLGGGGGVGLAVFEDGGAGEGEAGEEAFAVVEQEAAGGAGIDLDLDLHLVVVLAGDEGEEGAVLRAGAPGAEVESAVRDAGVLAGIAGGAEERPLDAELVGGEVVGAGKTVRHGRAAGGQGEGGGDVGDDGLHPAVLGPFDGFEEGLPAEVVVAVFIRVIDEIPLFVVGAGDEGGVAARPPFLPAGGGADDGVVGRIFPGAVEAAGAGHDDHVAGGGAGGAALGGDLVKPAVLAEKFGGFEELALGLPGARVVPAVVDFFFFTDHGEAVIGEADAVAFGEKEPAATVFVHGVAGVDVADVEFDGIAPRAANVGGPEHPVFSGGGEVDVVFAVVFDEVGSHGRTDDPGHGAADGFPVRQVLRVPDEEARRVEERRVRQVVVIAIAQDGGIGIVAAQDDGGRGVRGRELRGRRRGRVEGGGAGHGEGGEEREGANGEGVHRRVSMRMTVSECAGAS